MLFKDRIDAAEKLYKLLTSDPSIKQNKGSLVVVSLLRGAIVLGAYLSKKFSCLHLPLAAVKIPAPSNPELAIGALCFDVTYLDRGIIKLLHLSRFESSQQIKIARDKFDRYIARFNLNESLYKKIEGKTVILVDDGIATGASVKCAVLYLHTKKPKKLIVTAPVASSDFELAGIDGLYILHKDPAFVSVSRFYDVFPQIEDEEVKKYLSKKQVTRNK